MKVAIVHDYLKEFGGAERVLKTLSEMYPDAPIYTAFRVKNSTADKEFKNAIIVESWLAPLLKVWRLYSPLRFLTPLIWRSFDLSKYDLVITSCSWYITRGFRTGKNTKVIAYCHTPPRWLYGYEMSVGFTKYWPVKVYATIVSHFMRIYDFNTAQKINNWVANSKNVAQRIMKYYRKESTVIYPPIEVEKIISATKNIKKENYYLIVARLVGAKGLEQASAVAKKLGFELRIVGESHGFSDVEGKLKKLSGGNIKLLGQLSDADLYNVLGKAKGFIALAKEEDFGMTLVEAQAAGTPVVAFNGGGFKESVIEGKTGVFINEITEDLLKKAINKIESTRWNKEVIQANAKKFSKERFKKEIREFVESKQSLASKTGRM
ncbi:MAG: glycosyl transferase group 1 [uncultured bacterium]|nr:MAG: glycosyl transferase group 1 [uncultured bacterium]